MVGTAARGVKFALENAALDLRAGDSGSAERSLKTALMHNPQDPELLGRVAEIEAGRGRSTEAKLLLRRALSAAPVAHALRVRLARLLQARGEFAEALSEVQKLPVKNRAGFEIATLEAALLGMLGDTAGEIAIYERLVVSNNKSAELWKSLGDALKTVGRTADAIKAVRRAIRLRPTYGEAFWTLANFKSVEFDQRDLTVMLKALAGPASQDDKLHFHFAIAKALEDRGDYERSFSHYEAGNRIRSQSFTKEQTSAKPFVDTCLKTYTESFFLERSGMGHPAPDPIFVVGLQRSGSTLIEQILASHPDIEGTAELGTLQHIWNDLAVSGLAAGRSPFEELAALKQDALAALGKAYLDQTRQHRHTDRPFFVDKLPANWMSIGMIRLILPNAKIIDARRHPMACGFSNYKQHYATGVTFAYDLSSIGAFYADYLRLMSHLDTVQPGAVHHVLNEELIERPEFEIRRMFDYLGIPFHPACLDFQQNTRAIRTPSAEQVRRPINREGMHYWRNFEPWLQPLKAALGTAIQDWERK